MHKFTRITLYFAFYGIAFLAMVLDYIYKTHHKPGISCCGSNVCAEQHHHD